MNKGKRRVPKLRFPGFTEDWEQRKLDDIAKIKTGGGTPKTANPEYWSGNIPWIQSSDLVEGDIVHVNINKFINNNALKNSAAKLISRDSIVLVTRVGVGKVAVINQDFTTSQDFLSLSEFDGSDIKFLAYQLYRLMQENAKVLQGTSIKGITKTELIEQNISIPSSGQEQNLISDVLSKIDSIITLHQRKLEHLNLKKKTLLQKLFPKNGERYPELRFPGFTDAWEQCKFSDLYEKISEKNDLSYSLDKIISVANMYYKSDAKVSNEEYLKTYNIFRYGEIAFEGNKSKDFTYGRFVENTIGDGIISHVFEVFRPITKYDIYFWKYYINYEPIMGKVLSRCTKKTTMMTNLVAKDFLKETVFLPSLAEQKRIGILLNTLDKFITLHQRKLEHLQLHKKALLQQMFV